MTKRGVAALLCVLALLLAGCETAEERKFRRMAEREELIEEGYQDGYEDGYSDGYSDGYDRGYRTAKGEEP